MRRSWLVVLIGGALVLATAPARAEHNGPAPSRDSIDLNVDLEIGGDSFRLGGALFGRKGVYGAWINGALRPDGFTVDGRVQHPDHAYNFRLDADIAGWLRRSLGVFGHGI
jgi:hypothetical protein